MIGYETGIILLLVLAGLSIYFYRKDKKDDIPFDPPQPTPAIIMEGVLIGPATYIEGPAVDGLIVSTVSVVDGVVTYVYDMNPSNQFMQMPVAEFLEKFRRNLRKPPNISFPR